MNGLPLIILSKMKRATSAMILLGAIAGASGTALAGPGLTLGSSSGTSFYAVSNISTTNLPPSAFFNPDGSLVYPGGGLPKLSGLSDMPTQFSSQNTLNPPFTTNATTVPPSFGTASTQIYASNSGQEGGFTTQGGVFWTINTALADNLGGGSLASISLSTANATFTNNNLTAVTITPAAILSVNGVIGSAAGSYVAAGLTTSFSLSLGGVNLGTTALDPIVLAANNTPGNGVRISSTGGKPNEFGSLNVAGSSVTGTGTSFNQNSVTLVAGESITISGVLTLISDPDSSIGISQGLPLNFPMDPNHPGQPDPNFVPMFGVFADAGPLAAVPEPSTIVLLAAGLALTGLGVRSTRRRPSPES